MTASVAKLAGRSAGVMAKPQYGLTCMSCGEPFEASRRDARACSDKCGRRLREGAEIASPVVGGPATFTLHDLSPTAGAGQASERRTYVIYRGSLARPETLTISSIGRITDGAFFGVRIADLLRTAAERGWLAYRHRPDGWYAAEWCQERKTIALSGPSEAVAA